jgi:transposase
MNWNDTCPMNERLIFVAEIQRSERSMTQLCEDFGISRKTGYKWWRRYEAAGVDGLKERLRAPLSHPNAVKAAVVGLLLQARRWAIAPRKRSIAHRRAPIRSACRRWNTQRVFPSGAYARTVRSSGRDVWSMPARSWRVSPWV